MRTAARALPRAQRLYSTAAPRRECVLAKHPGVLENVSTDCFQVRDAPQLGPLEDGWVRCRTTSLSVDPYMRCMMTPGHPQLGEYLQPFRLGQPLSGGGVGTVVESRDSRFNPGDAVQAPFLGWPWQTVVDLDASDAGLSLSPVFDPERPSFSLGYLGMPGATAYFCMMDRGRPKPGETVVISGAAGACGTLAGQLAKLQGSRVVGICGSERKGEYLVSRLGFDGWVSYKQPAESMRESLGAACPSGVDVYYDNVGGGVSDCVLQMMNTGGRVPICGQIARYHDDVPYTKLVSPEGLQEPIARMLAERSVERGRFLVLDYQDRWAEGLAEVKRLIDDGSVKVPETVTVGFDPGRAFVEMMAGGNIGKAVVHLVGAGAEKDGVVLHSV